MMERIAILGLGLIGGSLARALHERKLCGHIAAYDTSRASLEFAQKSGFIDSAHTDAVQAVKGATLIIFAAPPSAFEALARDIKSSLASEAVVTDVASVKRQAITAITPHLPAHTHFVPAHPIAGSEKTGVQVANARLFAGKRVILTPQEQDVLSEPVKAVRGLWEALGTTSECMPAELHDLIYAYVSHLPQLVAFAARDTIKTRLAQSSPQLWADICTTNADFVGGALEDFISFGAQIAGELRDGEESNESSADATPLFASVVASCLIATASLLQERSGIHPAHYSGSGFADMTMAAKGDMHTTLEAISTQHAAIAALLSTLLSRLHRMQGALGNRADFLRTLENP